MREKPRVAIFILNYNSSGFLHLVYRSVESALNINYDNLDVIFIDNNSTDGSYEAVLDRFRGDLIFIKLGRNYGYAGGNELGFRRYAIERGFPDYAIFMNNDYVVINSDSVKEIIDFMERNIRVALTGGYNLMSNGKRIFDAGNFIDIFSAAVPRLMNLRPDEAPEKPSYISYPQGAFLVCKVKPILDTRGFFFQPKIFAYWDETELAASLWTHDLHSVSLPIEVGIHYTSTSFSKYPLLARYLLTRNWLAFLKSYWRGDLKIFAYLSRLKLSLTIFRGRRGVMEMRGFIDSNSLRFLNQGKFHPLIVMPRRAKMILKGSVVPFLRSRVLKDYYTMISNLLVTEEMIRSSPSPYIVPLNY